jgi:hypothetical protein
MFGHRVLKAHLVGHVHFGGAAFEAHPDQFGTGYRAYGKREVVGRIKCRFDDHSLPRLEPIHSAAQFNDPADGLSGPGGISIFCNCCGAVCVRSVIRCVHENLLLLCKVEYVLPFLLHDKNNLMIKI